MKNVSKFGLIKLELAAEALTVLRTITIIIPLSGK